MKLISLLGDPPPISLRYPQQTAPHRNTGKAPTVDNPLLSAKVMLLLCSVAGSQTSPCFRKQECHRQAHPLFISLWFQSSILCLPSEECSLWGQGGCRHTKPALHHTVPQPSKQETRPAFRNSYSRALSEAPREAVKEGCGVDFQATETAQRRTSPYRIPPCRNKEVLQDRNVLGI